MVATIRGWAGGARCLVRLSMMRLGLVAVLAGLAACGEPGSGPGLSGALDKQTTTAAAGALAKPVDPAGEATNSPGTALIAEKADVASSPVFRFAKISNGAYFFTGDAGEKDQILAGFPDFRCEGLAFFRTKDGSGVPVYRFANLGNGGYFYTANVAERDFVNATRPDMRFEGSTFSVVGSDTAGAQPVYRLANLNNGAYLFTANAAERDFAVGLGNWRDEGIAFYGAPRDEAQVGQSFCSLPGPVPTVASVASTVLPLRYGALTVFRVTGTNLDSGITFSSSACTGITEQPGGNATSRSYACVPNATGTVNFRITASDGTLLRSIDSAVPQPQVRLVTSLGDMVVQLDPGKAPITVGNFLQYVRDGHYSGLIFHRVVRSASFSIIQGGGFNTSFQQRAVRAPIVLESQNGLSNTRGTIAMARTSAPNTATAQFYFNTTDNLAFNYQSAANPGYAVFGVIVQGLAVMDAIGAVATGVVSGLADVPLTAVVITSATQTQ